MSLPHKILPTSLSSRLGFTPLQAQELNDVAAALEATPMQVALAWLLQRSPNILLIRAPLRSSTCRKTWPLRVNPAAGSHRNISGTADVTPSPHLCVSFRTGPCRAPFSSYYLAGISPTLLALYILQMGICLH
jgi:hypothetical protein